MNFLYRIQSKDNTLLFKTRLNFKDAYCVKNGQEPKKKWCLCFLKKEVSCSALKYFDLRILKGYFPQLFVMSQKQLSAKENQQVCSKIFSQVISNSTEENEKQKIIHHAFSLVK